MRGSIAIIVALAVSVLGSGARGADYKTLHAINGGPPTQVTPLAAASKPRPVQLVRVIVHPQDGGAWALEYGALAVYDPDHPPPPPRLVPWNGGAAEQKVAPFARVFDEELTKAGFAAQAADSLFDDNSESADLKVAVLVDDLKGRFCRDCGGAWLRKSVPASVMMTGHWEVYSTLERKVIAKITTSGAGDSQEKYAGSYLPGVLEGFRENVRQLLASEEFRRVVTNPSPGVGGSDRPAALAIEPIALAGPKAPGTVANAGKSVAIIYAADGQGSGFLISNAGYLLTNQHVVGGSKYVKVKWSDGAETVGEVVRTDARRDVALIKADPSGRPALALRRGAVQQGEAVFAIGTPLHDSLQNTMTKGIVSAERVEKGQRFIQSDVGVNHGNSGGPLLDQKGSVIAITDWGVAPDGTPIGLNFFIPIDDALKSLALTPAS
ncbi:MAG: trypsin-like serine protease [Phenylobacterium sp.]|nr:MAG: trypsin-like serine protease [Phenylobacterium sp.]